MKTFDQVTKGDISEGIAAEIIAIMPSAVINPKVLESGTLIRLNQRLGDEYAAHYFYRAASDWCRNQGFFKAASYFDSEMKGELEHAELIRKYLTDWNCMPQIPESQHVHSFVSLVDIINKAYILEYNLFHAYLSDSAALFNVDLATFDFLKQLRDIQTGAIAEYSDFLNGLTLINISNKLDLLYFENQNF
jgi:ferritin